MTIIEYEIIQYLGKNNSELVQWYGDLAIYEKKINVSDIDILIEFMKIINSEIK